MELAHNVKTLQQPDGRPTFGEFKTAERSQNTNCVEFGYRRVGGALVEIALLDSKDSDGSAFVLDPREYQNFIAGVKAGDFAPPEIA